MIVPDSIEPLILARSWIFDGNVLRSPQQAHCVWKPGEAFVATCACTLEGWQAGPEDGYTRQQIESMGNKQVPQVDLPQGLYYHWAVWPAHEGVPGEYCTCGVYGTTEEDRIIGTLGQKMGYTPIDFSGSTYIPRLGGTDQGIVVGSLVALWGTVIEGDKGARGEFAYPHRLTVPPSLANNEALQAYGVPIDVVGRPSAAGPVAASRRSRPHLTPGQALCGAAALNVGAATMNVLHMARVF